MFNHEKLKVYQRTLTFNAKVNKWIGQWDSRHAVGDQLFRAAGSILENISMASAAYSEMKIRSLDYAIGSTLECAACIDLACVKRLLDEACVVCEKEELSQILRMLVGLRQSWSTSIQMVREESAEYGIESATEEIDKAHDKDLPGKLGEQMFFHHEKLDVYRLAMETAKAFSSSEAVCRLPTGTFRRLDELLTSMVLNIAEGNGRFSGVDQRRFLDTSHEAAIKMATKLDLCVIQELLPLEEVEKWKSLLERISVMTSSLGAAVANNSRKVRQK